MQEKLLIIHQGAIGDIVSIFPAVIRLKEKFSRIDAIFKKSIGELAFYMKLIEKAYPAEAAFFSSMFSHGVDPVAVEILHLYDEILLFSYSQELEGIISDIVTKKIHRIPPRPDTHTDIHILNYILKQLAERGLIDNPAPPVKDYCSSLIEYGNTASKFGRSRIILHPGSGSMRKNWPAPNFIELFAMLKTAGMSPEILLGPAEHNLSEIFTRSLPVGTKILTPAGLLDIISILKQSEGFIGNDSGISHLSAFWGIPTVVIFGPSNPKRWKPFGRSVADLRPETDCAPCFETGRADCKKMKCLEQTTPEKVFNSLLKIYRQ